MPEVMTVISSDSVISGRYGRIVSGASVCPMKMLAATFSDSAPLALHHPVHHDREQPHDELHHAEVVEDGEQRGDEDDRRQHLEREDDGVARPFRRRAPRSSRGPRRCASPSGPNTNAAPTPAKPSSLLMPSPSVSKTRCPIVVFSTMQREDHLQPEAPRHRRPVDGAPVVRERVPQSPRMTTAPNSGCSDAEHQRTSSDDRGAAAGGALRRRW